MIFVLLKIYDFKITMRSFACSPFSSSNPQLYEKRYLYFSVQWNGGLGVGGRSYFSFCPLQLRSKEPGDLTYARRGGKRRFKHDNENKRFPGAQSGLTDYFSRRFS